MSEWIDIQEFSRNDTKFTDGSSLPAVNTATNGDGSIAPPIAITVDYYLRDSYGSVITNESGEAISLEGLEFSNA